MRASLNSLSRNKFARNVAIVASGALGAQIITMVFTPFVTRIYGPETFGLLGTFVAIVSVLAPCLSLSFPIAIALPEDDVEAKGLARLSFTLAFLMGAALALALWLGRQSFVELLNLQSIEAFIMFLPIALFLSVWLEIEQQWLIRKKRFGEIAKVAVVQAFLINSSKIGIGLFSATATVLISLTAVGSAMHAALLFKTARINEPFFGLNQIKYSGNSFLSLAKKYSDFPIYRTPQIFINAVSQSLPVIMLASFFGASTAGFYTLARLAMAMPSTLIGKSVGDVFYPRINDAARSGENITRLLIKASSILAVVGFLPFTIIVIFGPWVFSQVFGSEWGVSGEYARYLSLFFYLNLINRPSVSAVPMLGLQKGLLLYEIVSTGGKVIGLMIGFYIYKSDVMAIMLFSIIGALTYLWMIAWIIYRSKGWKSEKASR